MICMEHISIYPNRTTTPSLEDGFTPLVAKGFAYQVGEALRHARYCSDGGACIPVVPESSLRGAVEQYQDFYLAALQVIAGTTMAKPSKDSHLTIRYVWQPSGRHGFAITVGRLYSGSAVAARRTNRLRKYGLITTSGKSMSYEVNFLAMHPYVAEAFTIGLQHAAAHCDVELPRHLVQGYLYAAQKTAEAKCLELGATLHDKLYPGVF